MYAHKLKISFRLDLGRSFYSIFLKLDRIVDIMENYSFIVFGPNRLNEGELRSRKFQYFEK